MEQYEIRPGGALRRAERPGEGVCLVRMTEAEFAALAERMPHKRRLERSLETVRYCKAESFGDNAQGVLRLPGRGGETPLTFGFYLWRQELLLIGGGEALERRLEGLRDTLPGDGSPRHLLLVLLEHLIGEDLPYLQEVEERLEDIEEGLLQKVPEHFYQTVIGQGKELSALHAYYEQLIDMGDHLGEEAAGEEARFWQLFTNRAERLHNHVEMLREYLLQIRELYQTQIDVQQNRVMTILTVVTTLFLPLSLIAGWYGMNFPNIPILHWRYGYAAVAAVSAGIVAAEILYFKRKKML